MRKWETYLHPEDVQAFWQKAKDHASVFGYYNLMGINVWPGDMVKSQKLLITRLLRLFSMRIQQLQAIDDNIQKQVSAQQDIMEELLFL